MNIRKAPQRGCNQCESLIVVALIGIIAAIAIPNLLAARRSSNTAAAIKTMRNLHSAEMSYSLGIGKGNFSDHLSWLSLGQPNTISFFDDFSEEVKPVVKGGYILGFLRKQNATSNQKARYWAVYRPVRAIGNFRTGNDIFYVDETGIIRHSCSPTVWPDETSDPVR